MKHQSGAVFFILSGYTNAAGELCVGRYVLWKLSDEYSSHVDIRYETEGSTFIEENKKPLRTGPHNVMDMWSTYLEGRNHVE